MGSSTRKRSLKTSSFTKPKLKVGKARPKPANHTDTSFKSRSIAIPSQQSLYTAPPTTGSLLSTHLSHLKSSSPGLRADHLAALYTLLSPPNPASTSALPIPASTILTHLTPLLLDPSNRVRETVLRTFHVFRAEELVDAVANMMPYLRAGITSLSAEVRGTGVEALGWLCGAGAGAVGRAVVGCPGGWVRGLKTLCVLLGWWDGSEQQGRGGGGGIIGRGGRKEGEWTSVNAAAAGAGGGVTGQGKFRGVGVAVKALGTLAAFLRCGLLPETPGSGEEVIQMGRGRALGWPLWNVQAHMLPERPNAFGYLNLFGEKRDEEGEVYEGAEDRRRVFRSLGYEAAILRGVEAMRKEGGEVGRAAGMLMKVLKEVEYAAE